MARSPISHDSGLERDLRQDEFPVRLNNEFSTRQDEFPIAYSPNGQTLHVEDPRVLSETKSNLPLHQQATKTRGRLCGLRKSNFLLVVVLLALLVFTGIGVGVLGSKLKNSEQKSSHSSSLSSTTAAPFSSSSTIISPAASSRQSSSSQHPTSSSSSSSSSTSIPVVRQLTQPDNDCEAVGSQYLVQSSTFRGETVKAQFTVSCNTDFGGGDFMSFYSPSLTTCMHGCSMFNYWQSVYKNHLELNCSGVTYLPANYGEGNCWLKPWGYSTARMERKNCSYAFLNR